MQPKYYQPSEELNSLNLVNGLLILLAITMIIGYIYSLLIFVIPLVYLNFVIAVGLGVALSYCIRFIIRWVKIRDDRSRQILVVFGILFVSFFQWTAFVDSVLLERFPTPIEYIQSFQWIFAPQEYLLFIGEIYKYGTWGMILSNFQFNGILLLAVWLVELIVIASPSIKLISNYDIFPFSEKLNKWYPKYTLIKDFKAMASKNSIEEKLDSGVMEALNNLEEGSAVYHTRIQLFYLEGEENHYLNVNKVKIERGSNDESVTPLIKNYRIDSATANDIRRQFKMEKERFDIF